MIPLSHPRQQRRLVAFARGFSAGIVAIALVLSISPSARAADAPTGYKFSLAPGGAAAGYTQITPQSIYSDSAGFGFEPGTPKVTAVDGGKNPAAGCITAAAPFYFSAKLPEGNYRVTVTLGDPTAESITTVKAELRRLMLERIHADAGQTVTRTFVVNIRTPKLAGGKEVGLKDRERQSEARAWDDKLTLEFSDQHPAVSSIEIAPAGKVTTVYIIGDSTVCDQPDEPYNSWGQMLPRWFKPSVAVANHAESGETAGGFAGGRMTKIMGTMTAGDYLIMQFGHNDMKSNAAGAVDRYKQLLGQFCTQTRAKGATPIICTAVSRKSFGPDGKIKNSFITSQGDYIAAAKQVAADQKVQLIDLNALTATFYEAVGPADAGKLFAAPNQGTHHGDYGSYEVAKLVVQGIKNSGLPLAAEVVEEWKTFDPAHFDPIAEFKLPADPGRAAQAPLGS